MPARRLEITVSEETWERLEATRGHEPRASFVKRALESALDRPIADRSSAPPRSGGSAARDSAPGPVSSRAPVEKEPSEEVGPDLHARDTPVSRSLGRAGAAPSRQAKEYELPKIAPRRTR